VLFSKGNNLNKQMKISVREFKKEDIELIIDYFINSNTEYLKGMGAIKSKFPTRKKWLEKLYQEIVKSNTEKEFYYVIWEIDNVPVGHSNINNITFGKQATMHLHLWQSNKRKKGLGVEFIKQTIPFYFKYFELEKLICEPYAQNITPNKVLEKNGFEFINKYETIPGWINFKQFVNRYELTAKTFKKRPL
jgi:RimJ/RimL family protein N-acetyltransferase